MLTIGVDVGGTSVRAAVVDTEGRVLEVVRTETVNAEEPLEAAIAGAVRELAGRYPVRAVGVALAGFVTPDRQTVRFAPHLPWRNVRVADRLAHRCALPVVMEHDANAAAFAEHRFGAAAEGTEPVGPMLFIALGTGIGGALIVNGRLYRGGHGVAPELGHLRLVPEGRACPCGKRGCWERYCSGSALVTTAREMLAQGAAPPGESRLAELPPAARHELTGLDVAQAARAGDPVGRRAVEELARWLGEGLALAADVYDPTLVVLGGGVSDSAPLFLDAALRHYSSALTGAGHRPLARVRVAQLGGSAGVIGAAELARIARRDQPSPVRA